MLHAACQPHLVDVVSRPLKSTRELVFFQDEVKRLLVISKGGSEGAWPAAKLMRATDGGRAAMPEKLYSYTFVAG